MACGLAVCKFSPLGRRLDLRVVMMMMLMMLMLMLMMRMVIMVMVMLRRRRRRRGSTRRIMMILPDNAKCFPYLMFFPK